VTVVQLQDRAIEKVRDRRKRAMALRDLIRYQEEAMSSVTSAPELRCILPILAQVRQRLIKSLKEGV
jgi:hypothetical protein